MEALGLVEVIGLPAGVEAADVACKTSNVALVGYELAKGGGLVTIKVLGQVSDVQAAVDAAAAAAGHIGKVVSRHVIARPSEQLDILVHSKTTVGLTRKQTEASAQIPAKEAAQPPKDEA